MTARRTSERVTAPFMVPRVVTSWQVPSFKRHVFVCINERPADHPKGCCKAKGGPDVRDELKRELKARGISKLVRQAGAEVIRSLALAGAFAGVAHADPKPAEEPKPSPPDPRAEEQANEA